MLSGANDLYAVPLQLKFNPAVLQLVNVDAGDLLSRDGQPVSIVHRDEGNGSVTVSTSRPPGTTGINGQGTLARATAEASIYALLTADQQTKFLQIVMTGHGGHGGHGGPDGGPMHP